MRPFTTLEGRSVVVVGASGSIGSAIVRAFARLRAHLVLAAPQSEVHLLDRLAADAEALGARALVVGADITDREQVDRITAAAIDAYGTIDVLLNVAGIGSSPSLCNDTAGNIERVLAVNLLGPAWTMHAVLPIMKARRRGAIVNIGSIAGEAGVMGIYSGSKFGLRGLTDTVRREARSYGIGVTLIEPGFVRSQMNVAMGDGLPSPDVVANAAVRAIRSPRRRIIVPGYYAVPVLVANLFPGLIDLVFGDARIQQRLNRDWIDAREREPIP